MGLDRRFPKKLRRPEASRYRGSADVLIGDDLIRQIIDKNLKKRRTQLQPQFR
jgi:hypothetical protein